MTASRLISILTAAVAILTFVVHYGGGLIPAEYMPWIAAIAAAVTAFNERIQGSPNTRP